jgi:hypothetical protein
MQGFWFLAFGIFDGEGFLMQKALGGKRITEG